ncbi:MAG: CPBP family intramembrane glutamic endopeptidase [Ferruginibacter sp.]
MYKKILMIVFLSVAVYAFPLRVLGFEQDMEALLKVFKCILVILIVLFLYRKDIKKDPIQESHWNKHTFYKIAPSLILLMVYIAVSYNGLFRHKNDLVFVALTIIATFVAATAEEVIFRLYLFNLFVSEGYKNYRAIIFSSILFSLMHIVNIFRYDDIWAIVNQLILAFFMGILLCSLYTISRSILLVSVYHFIVNIPLAMKRIAKVPVENNAGLEHLSLGENIFSVIMYTFIFSPLIIVALYYLNMYKKEETI